MIIDTLKYFAKYPKKIGVQKLFNNGRSSVPGYAQLHNHVNGLPSVGLIDEIDHFLFGESLDKVKRTIIGYHGTFLFVDFGNLESNGTPSGSVSDSFSMAATIAKKVPSTCDLVEETLVSDAMLSLINRMRAQMMIDSRQLEWLQQLSKSHQVAPFVSDELSAIGWTLVFSRTGVDLLNVKSLMD